MLAAQPGRLFIPAQAAAHPFNPVSHYRFAITGATQYHPPLNIAGSNSFGNGADVKWVIDRGRFGIRTLIDNFVSQTCEELFNGFFITETSVIGAYGNFHM